MKGLLVLCLLCVFYWNCGSGLGIEGTPLACAVSQEYVPVLAYESDPEKPLAIQAVPIGHFHTDEKLRPIGLCKPRVKIELCEEVLVEVNESELQTGRTVPNPIPEVKPNKEGAFIDGTNSTLTAMVTAFVTATRVIENAEHWTGHRIDWGHNGRLVIVPYAFVTDSFNCHYDPDKRILFLGALGCMNMEEGLADSAAFLISLDDPDVVERVLEETGGDLRKDNEASHGCASSSDVRLTATMMTTRRTTITGSYVR